MATTANQLISAVLVDAHLPKDSTTGLVGAGCPYTDAEILAKADREILGEFWPRALKANGAYYVTHQDTTMVDASDNFELARYRIPDRVYGPLVDVLYVDDAHPLGISIDEVTIEEIPKIRSFARSDSTSFYPERFAFDGDAIRLDPPQGSLGTGAKVRFRFAIGPGQLTLYSTTITSSTQADLIEAAYKDDDDSLISLTNATAGDWITASSTVVDIISAGNAHATIVHDELVAGLSGLDVTLTNNVRPRRIVAGDYMALAGYTPIVQLPDSMIPALIRRVSAELGKPFVDQEAARLEDAAANRLASHIDSVVKPRSRAEPMYMRTRNSPFRMDW